MRRPYARPALPAAPYGLGRCEIRLCHGAAGGRGGWDKPGWALYVFECKEVWEQACQAKRTNVMGEGVSSAPQRPIRTRVSGRFFQGPDSNVALARFVSKDWDIAGAASKC